MEGARPDYHSFHTLQCTSRKEFARHRVLYGLKRQKRREHYWLHLPSSGYDVRVDVR